MTQEKDNEIKIYINPIKIKPEIRKTLSDQQSGYMCMLAKY